MEPDHVDLVVAGYRQRRVGVDHVPDEAYNAWRIRSLINVVAKNDNAAAKIRPAPS